MCIYICCMCGVFCVWIAVAGVVDECAGRAPSVAGLARVRVDMHVCVSRAGCVAAGIWIGAATGR